MLESVAAVTQKSHTAKYTVESGCQIDIIVNIISSSSSTTSIVIVVVVVVLLQHHYRHHITTTITAPPKGHSRVTVPRRYTCTAFVCGTKSLGVASPAANDAISAQLLYAAPSH
jgi:hypothetical protein